MNLYYYVYFGTRYARSFCAIISKNFVNVQHLCIVCATN